MTALNEYQRIEASGLWRASPDAQRCDVIVSIGDATLTITDMRDRALAHWSLPAIERANPGQLPAIYHPDGDPGETLELPESEADVIAAIEKLRAAIARHRPHPGRLRLVMFAASVAMVAGLALFWLPGATRQHAVSVVPDVKRAEIGQALLGHVQKVTGPPCRDSGGLRALAQLANRLPAPDGSGKLVVVRNGVQGAIHLPGGTIVINRALVEDFEEPDVVAGYIVAEHLRSQIQDPLEELLSYSGLWSSFRLLTTGALKDEVLQAYAKHLLTRPKRALGDDNLLKAFKTWSVRSTPYAYAKDISGETTLGLIEADPFVAGAPEAVLSDANWLRLQGICGG
ncbi:hypothetical protein PEL8287_01918 [Roseovarius litorisediminis]|uniref:Uncharacterized protein n=1 Tax=Roseovarius litorisediminis TaxID=1312363 RepID=A0A1Y5SEQ4_9RHOB|nr:hypothetical protein [Roseovarius litorisediminis]SLN39081.1 hypothetical protein PEL8287_01918 [Roseovarius litorisediminis]